jgi:hypothetical protein
LKISDKVDSTNHRNLSPAPFHRPLISSLILACSAAPTLAHAIPPHLHLHPGKVSNPLRPGFLLAGLEGTLLLFTTNLELTAL